MFLMTLARVSTVFSIRKTRTRLSAFLAVIPRRTRTIAEGSVAYAKRAFHPTFYVASRTVKAGGTSIFALITSDSGRTKTFSSYCIATPAIVATADTVATDSPKSFGASFIADQSGPSSPTFAAVSAPIASPAVQTLGT